MQYVNFNEINNDFLNNYLDLFDTAQPLTCSGSATNYMAGNDVFYSYTANDDSGIFTNFSAD